MVFRTRHLLRCCCSRQCQQFPGPPRISAGKAGVCSPTHEARPEPPHTLQVTGGYGNREGPSPSCSVAVPCLLWETASISPGPRGCPSTTLAQSTSMVPTYSSPPALFCRHRAGLKGGLHAARPRELSCYLFGEQPPYLGAAASAPGGGSLPEGGVSSAGVGSWGGSDSVPVIGSLSVGLADGVSSDPAAAWSLVLP